MALALTMLMSLFSVAFNVSAASHYDELDLLSGSLFDSTAVITSDGTNVSLSNEIWSFSTLAGQGAEYKNISEIEGITIDDGKTLLSKSDREGVKFYAINNNNGTYTSAFDFDGNSEAILKDFDGQVGAHTNFQGLNQLVTETSSGVYNSRRDYNYSADIIVDLGSVCDISGFMVSGSNSERFVPGMYRIYASKERATLYNNKPLIEFTDSYASDSVAMANANAIFSLNEGSKVLARYIMFRFADVCSQNIKDQGYDFMHNNFRGSELAVYGTPVVTKEGVSGTVETSATPAAPEGYDSLVIASEGEYVLPSKTDLSQSKSATKNPTTNLYDGIYAANGYDDYTVTENANGYGQQSSTLGYTVDDSFYSQITHEITTSTKVRKIQVVGHSNAMLTTGRYVLYAGNDKSTLYSPENIIYDYDNSTIVNENNVCALTGNNATLISRQQIFDFGEGFNAKYIGMRVYDPCGYIGKVAGTYNAPGSDGGAIYLRLHEFNVFGISEYSVTNNAYSFAQYEENVDIARSLIADKAAVYTRYNNYLTGDVGATFTPSYVAVDAAPDTRSLTSSHAIPIGNLLSKGAFYALDLKNSSGVEYAEGETKDNVTDTYVDNGVDMNNVFAYDMGGEMQVESFSFISHTTAALQVAKYQVSFANDAEKLFTDDAVYTTEVLNATASSATLNFRTEIVAQYVGYKVVSGVRPTAVGTYDQGSCYTRLSHIDVFGHPYGSLSTVTFLDKQNNVLHTASTDAQGYLSETDLEFAAGLVPAIYGYNKKIGEKGQEWSADVYGAVLENITVTPAYEKDSTLKYTLTHNKTQGDPVVETVEFDQHVTVTDDAAASFKVGDSVIGGAGSADFYAAGDITVDSSTDAAPTTPTVTILNAVTEKSGSKYNWRVFAHAYVPEGYSAVETGAIFTSPYTEKQLSKDGYTDWDFATLGTKYPYVQTKGADGAAEAMLTLNGAVSGATRYVKAYVAYTDGSATGYAYSQKLTKVFGE